MSVHSRSSLSSATSSTRRSALDDDEDESEQPFDWDEDPSFSSNHFQTSTPLKSARRTRAGVEQDEEEEGLLRASDTESLDEVQGDNTSLKTATRLRLTRRSLSHFSAVTNASSSSPPPTNTSSRPFNSSPTHSRRAIDDLQPSPPFGTPFAPSFTPSASTGSSTLVERDEVVPSSKYSRAAKGKGREDITIRANGRAGIISPLEEEQLDEDDGSSSSPRPLRSKARRPGELSSFIDSRTAAVSTPPPSSRASHPSRSSSPSTPLAPGAYPATARKLLARRSPPTSTPSASSAHAQVTPESAGSSHQVHDAFKRHMTGPEGALIHSAERRAALAAAALSAPASVRREPPTPHPAGYYAFSPSTSLPVEREREQRRVKEMLPSTEERRKREVTWREDVAGGDEDEEYDEEGQAARADDSPSNRPSARAAVAGPSKLERTLRHIGQLQRETEGRRNVFEAPAPPSPPTDVDLDDHEYGEEVEMARQEVRRAHVRVRARDYEGDYESEDEASDEEAPRIAGRSAIDFAMARSFAVSPGGRVPLEEEVEDPPAQYEAARKPSPPPLPPPSTTRRSPFRPPSPPSPSLPELPPMPSPQSSPTKPRAPLRRSPASRAADPPHSPPRAPPTHTTSPPRTAARQRRPSHEALPPTSSTPPRRFVDPPAPQGTPLAPPHLAPPTRAKSTSLSASLNAPRAPSEPTPRRRATSVSPSRAPLSSSVSQPLSARDVESNDESLPAIVAELAEAVRVLSAGTTGAGELRADGLPRPSASASASASVAGLLARRKKESDGRRQGLESELRVLEDMGHGEMVAREDVMDRLGQAQEVERALGEKVDQLLRSMEQMGLTVGNQVANVVQDTLQDEARKRTSWFAMAFCIQLFVFWVAIRIANSRTSDLYNTIYYDPFSPALFHLSAAHADAASVLPQTLDLFATRAVNAPGALGVLKGWFGGRLRQVAAWGVDGATSAGRGSWVPS